MTALSFHYLIQILVKWLNRAGFHVHPVIMYISGVLEIHAKARGLILKEIPTTAFLGIGQRNCPARSVMEKTQSIDINTITKARLDIPRTIPNWTICLDKHDNYIP